MPSEVDVIHYSKFEALIREYFEIDGLSSNVIVSYLLHKNQSFDLIKIDQILSMLYENPSELEIARISASNPSKNSRRMVYNEAQRSNS